MKQTKTRGKTSFSLPVFIADTSSTTGGGLSGVTSASSGLVLEYRRQGQSSWTSVTPQAGKTLGSYLSGGIVADGSLNGAYEVDFPDAAFASAAGVEWVACRIRGVTNMLPVLIEVQLDVVDYQTDAFGAIKPTTAGRTLDVTATGAAGIDLANVENQGSTLDLTGTTIKTATDIETDTQDIQNRLPSGLVDGRMASIAQVVGDKTGYKLASDGLSLVTAWAVAITGNITGNLVGDVTGEVAELGPNALSANSLTDEISLAVWNALTTATYVDQSFGDRILISANNTRQVAVNGNGHVAGVLHDAEPDSIPEDAFVSGAISARAIGTDAIDADALADGAITAGVFAADSITATALATSAGEEIADKVWDEAIAAHLASGSTGEALNNSGGSGGGTDWTANERTAIRSILGIPASGTTPADPSVGILDTIRDGVNSIGINVYPVTSSTPERVNGTTITVYKDEQTNVTISTTATLTGLTLRFVAEDRTGADVLVVENASFVARTATSVTLQIPSSVTDEIASYTWTLRDVTTGNSVLARGVLSVQAAASKNA